MDSGISKTDETFRRLLEAAYQSQEAKTAQGFLMAFLEAQSKASEPCFNFTVAAECGVSHQKIGVETRPGQPPVLDYRNIPGGLAPYEGETPETPEYYAALASSLAECSRLYSEQSQAGPFGWATLSRGAI